MAFKFLNVFLAVLVTILINRVDVDAVTSADIKAKITPQNAAKYVGIGGRYGRLVDTVSKNKIIESDHFPPKSAYAHAKDAAIKGIKERDMGAVSMSHNDHRILLTTGSANEKAGYFNQWIIDHFKVGEYYQGIQKNIQVYKEDKILKPLMKGVMDTLNVHVANKLITDAQRKSLIKEFDLESYDKDFEKDKDRVEAIKVVQA